MEEEATIKYFISILSMVVILLRGSAERLLARDSALYRSQLEAGRSCVKATTINKYILLKSAGIKRIVDSGAI